MAKFKPYRVEQLMLFPNSIKDYVSENHLARIINIVEHSELGQKTYHPKILVKLLFYGYAIGERSGRGR